MKEQGGERGEKKKKGGRGGEVSYGWKKTGKTLKCNDAHHVMEV